MGLIQNIYNYFRGCPLIDEQARLRFNSLGAQPSEYTIDDEGPENPVIMRYMDGSTLRIKSFSLGSRMEYGEDERVNISNSGYFEQLQAWVEAQNHRRDYPQMDPGQRPMKLEALTSGYLFTTEAATARYQIQLRLTYYQKGER